MSVTTYAILGFAMMLILTAVLVSGKFTPSIPMIVIPIIFCSNHASDICRFIRLGNIRIKRTGQ